METKPETRYKLARGSQVREEAFGLLFYTMAGPRLFFLSCGGLLDRDFFNGKLTLETWIRHNRGERAVPEALMLRLINSLRQLEEKGVIIEC
jgi:putative mycofactocin binding protein MftB